METRQLHPWNVTPKEAIEIQRRLRPRLRLKKLSRNIQYVAGADVSSSKKSNTVWAGVVVLRYPDLVSVEEKWFKAKTDFPYVPGLLSFREIPVLLQALKRLEIIPDLILCDGQGIAHPRGLGLASHLGLLVDRPTIGCAKSRLVGEFSAVGMEKGSYTYLWYKGHVIGAVARTRTGVKPLFISPGNRVTLEESLEAAFRCCKKYRVPQPTRLAHLLVNAVRRREEP